MCSIANLADLTYGELLDTAAEILEKVNADLKSEVVSPRQTLQLGIAYARAQELATSSAAALAQKVEDLSSSAREVARV